MITIKINESQIEIEENTNVLQLLKKINVIGDGIALAINNRIISRHSWESQQLKQNDNILIIKATQGG